MKTFFLALRNLFRNRNRSVVTVLAMIVGTSAILLFGGFSRFITYALQTGYVQYAGHLQVQRQGYFLYGSGNPAAFGVPDYQRIIDAVKNDPQLAPLVTVVTPTLELHGIAGNSASGVSRTVIARGVVTDEQNRLRRWNDYRLENISQTLPLSGTPANAAVIGLGLARVLQLCAPLHVQNCPSPPQRASEGGGLLPDEINALASLERTPARITDGAGITLLAANVHGAPNVADLNVVKTEAQGIKEWDDVFITLHLNQAQQLLFGSNGPQATAIAIQLHHTAQIPAAKAHLQRLMNTALKNLPLEVLDFTMLFPFYGQAIQMFGVIFTFISVLIGVVVLFTIGNTMSMAVIERTVEIGTLRAIGLRCNAIRQLFVVEGLLLGIVGALLGVVVALALAWAVNHSGITWVAPGQSKPVLLTVRLWGEFDLIVSAVVGAVVMATLSAWWPARRAAGMNIVDALRHV
jgi:putative ABC transport system permease protein